MKKEKRKIDILNDNPVKILFFICLPLVLVSICSIFTASITNDIYSKYVGQTLFTVMGLLSLVTEAFINIIAGIVSSAWIRTAVFYTEAGTSGKNKYTINALYAILIAELTCAFLLLIGSDLILHAINVPMEVFDAAKEYYIVYVACYVIVAISSFLVMIVNGIGKVTDIFIVNCVNSCGTALVAVIVLVVFRGGITGAAALLAGNALLLTAVCLGLLKKNGFPMSISRMDYKPDFTMIWEIIRYGLLIALQSMISTVGYLCVTVQTNKYLSLDYISVLNVGLPLSGILVAFSTACMVFVPQNYGAGKYERVKKFFAITLGACVGYGIIIFAIHALLGEWYYGRLFDSPQIIAYGKEYWFWNGLGYIFVAVIYVVRYFFDAVGLSKVSLFSGMGELIGNLFCAFYLIPIYGNIGRNISYALGWLLGATFLLISYTVCRKKIYGKREEEKLETR